MLAARSEFSSYGHTEGGHRVLLLLTDGDSQGSVRFGDGFHMARKEAQKARNSGRLAGDGVVQDSEERKSCYVLSKNSILQSFESLC